MLQFGDDSVPVGFPELVPDGNVPAEVGLGAAGLSMRVQHRRARCSIGPIMPLRYVLLDGRCQI